MRIYYLIVFGFIFLIGFNNIKSDNQIKAVNFSGKEVTSQTASFPKDIDLKGLWVSSEYIEKINKTHSITNTEANFDFFVSLLFKDDNSVDVLEINDMEPSSGMVKKESKTILISNQTYSFSLISNEIIAIKKGNVAVNFLKLNGENCKKPLDGLNYLRSYLLLGNYRLIDSYSNKNSEISFKINNQMAGYLDYIHYYPSSYLEKDIVLFRKGDKQTQQSFVIKANNLGFILEEVENFDWDDQPFVFTGKKFVIEKTE